MSYLVLARKYRPQTFDEVIGQEHVTRTLVNAVTASRVAHAILFAGPRGTGKTTIARILAKTMNCRTGEKTAPCNQCKSCKEITSGNAADVFEIDGASNNSVDQIRELRENIKYMPQHSPYKIYIIDEVHMLSVAAFNALLKTLEEPPEHVMFLFATTESHKIPITILSRCQRHDLRRISLEAIVDHLAAICDKEECIISRDSLSLIAREAGGCMRDALSLLDQIAGGSQQQLDPESIPELLGITSRKIILDLSQSILDQNIPGFLSLLDDVFLQGKDLKKVYADLIEHFRNLLVLRLGDQETGLVDIPRHEIDTLRKQAAPSSVAHLSRILEILLREEAVIRYASQPKIAFEVTAVKIIQIPTALSIETLIEKLDQLQNKWPEPPPLKSSPESQELPEPVTPKKIPAEPPPVAVPADRSEDKQGKQSVQTAKPDIDLSNPRQVWRKLQAGISEKIPSLVAPLSRGKISKLNDEYIRITVEGSPFIVNRIQSKQNELNQICRDLLQKPVKLELDLQIQPGSNQQKTATEKRLKKETTARHPLVSDAIDIFNGNIVDVKIL